MISALNEICLQQPRLLTAQTITIADLGCGGGDLLRAVHEWAKAKSLNVELIGIDANPFVVRYAVGPVDQVIGLAVYLATRFEFPAELFDLVDVDLHLFTVLDQILSLTTIVDELKDHGAHFFVSELNLERRLVRVIPERSGQ